MVAVTLESIQTGSELVEDTDGTSIDVTITAVDLARSIVIFTTRHTENTRDTRQLFAVSLTTTTNINFERTNSSFADDLTIEWTVIEFTAGVLKSLQTISADWYTTTSNTITAVDTTNSIIVWSRRTDQNGAFNQGETVLLEFNGAGTAVNAVGLTAADKAIGEAFVLEFNDGVDVQHFNSNLANGTESDTQTITSVDLTATMIGFLGFDSQTQVAGDLNRFHPIVELTNATTVTYSRNMIGSVDPELDISYSVIEFLDGQTVEQFNTTITDTNTAPASQPTFTEMGSASIMFSGTQILPTRGDNSNDDGLGSFSVSAALDDPPDGVTLTRGGSVDTIELEGFAVDFGEFLVKKTIGATSRDYATFALAEAAVPSSLVTNGDEWLFDIYADSDFTLTANVDWSGHTSDATHRIILQAASGEAFYDTIDKNDRLALSGSNGVLVTGSLQWNSLFFNDTSDYMQMHGLQFFNTGSNGSTLDFDAAYCLFNRLLIYTKQVAFNQIRDGSVAVNCLIVQDDVSTDNLIRSGGYGDDVYVIHCTIVNTDNNTGSAFLDDGTTDTIISNCLMLGFNTDPVNGTESTSSKYNAHDGSGLLGSNHVESIDIDNQIEGRLWDDEEAETPTSNFDARLISGSDAVDAGSKDDFGLSIDITIDILGQTRDTTTPSIGAFEYTPRPSYLNPQSGVGASGTTFTLSSYATPPGDNKILFAAAYTQNLIDGTGSSSATYNGNAMTLAATIGDGADPETVVDIFTYDLGSTTPTGNIVVTSTDSTFASMGIAAFVVTELEQQAAEASETLASTIATISDSITTTTNNAVVLDFGFDENLDGAYESTGTNLIFPPDGVLPNPRYHTRGAAGSFTGDFISDPTGSSDKQMVMLAYEAIGEGGAVSIPRSFINGAIIRSLINNKGLL